MNHSSIEKEPNSRDEPVHITNNSKKKIINKNKKLNCISRHFIASTLVQKHIICFHFSISLANSMKIPTITQFDRYRILVFLH